MSSKHLVGKLTQIPGGTRWRWEGEWSYENDQVSSSSSSFTTSTSTTSSTATSGRKRTFWYEQHEHSQPPPDEHFALHPCGQLSKSSPRYFSGKFSVVQETFVEIYMDKDKNVRGRGKNLHGNFEISGKYDHAMQTITALKSFTKKRKMVVVEETV